MCRNATSNCDAWAHESHLCDCLADSTLDFPVTKNHIIATRAVGDGTFFCLVRVSTASEIWLSYSKPHFNSMSRWSQALADRLVVHSDVQVPGSVVYNYFWTHKPATSLNMASLDSEGAFHGLSCTRVHRCRPAPPLIENHRFNVCCDKSAGSEVPFVFGYPAELATPEVRILCSASAVVIVFIVTEIILCCGGMLQEISLSASMSCYWANFAWSGNPNVGKCNNSLLAPVEWTQYVMLLHPNLMLDFTRNFMSQYLLRWKSPAGTEHLAQIGPDLRTLCCLESKTPQSARWVPTWFKIYATACARSLPHCGMEL